MKARVKLFSDCGEQIAELVTDGNPPLWNERRTRLVGLPFETPAALNDCHHSATRVEIVYDYNPATREARSVSIPPKGRIEISAV